MAEEQIDFGEEEYGGGTQKVQYHGRGAIPALADDEMMGEEDEYDDLYNDVNVGEGFLQMHRPEAPLHPGGFDNEDHQTHKIDLRPSSVEVAGSREHVGHGLSTEGKYPNAVSHVVDQKELVVAFRGSEPKSDVFAARASVAQTGNSMGTGNEVQARNTGFIGSTSMTPSLGVHPSDANSRVASHSDNFLRPGSNAPQAVSQVPLNQLGGNVDTNRTAIDENHMQPPMENGSTTLFVGELHWWTTDAEIESILSQYGKVKELKFFDERASGKSKGYCQVDFYDPTAAAACKVGMNGHVFNGRACVVAFASQQTLKQMGASYANKNQVQPQTQPPGRRSMNDGTGRGGGTNFQGGDAGRNYGRGGWNRGGQGSFNRGGGAGGQLRGRGGAGPRSMMGTAAAGGYGQSIGGPYFGAPGGVINPQGMMGPGFDPTFMGRGGGYGGFPGPAFPGIMPSFPGVNTMGLGGVAPHVNPAFFARGMATNGMGMMGSTGMDMQMWNDPNMGGWGAEGTRESSYGGDLGASEYGYGEANLEKAPRRSATSKENDRGSERDGSGKPERRHHDDKEEEWDPSDREHREPRHREERDDYQDRRHRERDSGYEDDWDRGHSSRPRSRSRAMPDEDHRYRSRDADHGRKRRLPSE